MAVVLVAVEVENQTQEQTEQVVSEILVMARKLKAIDCWWIAEDNRHDGSDCDSAIFVPMGRQEEMKRVVHKYMDYNG